MNFGKIKQILIIFLIIILCSFVSYKLGLSQIGQTLKTIIEPGSMVTEASYIIFTDGSTVYARDGNTGEIVNSGTDASTVINWALGQLTNGGKVFIKAGVYTIQTTILVKSKISLLGEGRNVTILQGSGAINILKFDASAGDLEYIEISDLSIYGQSSSVGDDLVTTVVSGDNRINRLTLENIWLKNIKAGKSAVVIRNPEFVTFKACAFSVPADGATFASIIADDYASGYVNFEYNGFAIGAHDDVTCIKLTNTANGGQIKRVKIKNNNFWIDSTRTGNIGIYVRYGAAAGDSFEAIDIDGNHFEMFKYCVDIDGYDTGHLIHSTWIHNNEFTDTQDSVQTGQSFIKIGEFAKATLIYANHFRGKAGNDVVGVTDANPTSTTPTKIMYNEFRNVNLSVNGTSATKIQFNIGYVTESSNTVSYTGSATSFTVNHGLAATPKIVTVTPQQSGQGKVWVTDKNAARFTINFDTAPESSTWYFDWYAEV